MAVWNLGCGCAAKAVGKWQIKQNGHQDKAGENERAQIQAAARKEGKKKTKKKINRSRD